MANSEKLKALRSAYEAMGALVMDCCSEQAEGQNLYDDKDADNGGQATNSVVTPEIQSNTKTGKMGGKDLTLAAMGTSLKKALKG